jgi:hypothetical protein
MLFPLVERIDIFANRPQSHRVLTGILAGVGRSFLPFSGFQCKGRRIQEPSMKKPKIEAEQQPPREIMRADKPPTTGYSLVVDGHFKSHHDTVEAAEAAGMALKNQFQMLQVQVYDASTKTRSMIQWPAPA